MGTKGKTRPHSTARAFLEFLESREFLSSINVIDFGAVANDGGDDRGAIMAAISASKAGDTILFPGGTFNLSDELQAPGDRTYQGANGATLAGRGPHGQLVHTNGNNVAFKNLTFSGGGLFIDHGVGFNQNVTIDNNVFRLATSGEHPSAITFTSGLSNSRITNNYFTGYQGGFGIYGYSYSGVTISNNEFVNINAGMHIDAFGNSGNLLVEQNYMTGLHGMGMEFQGTATGMTFQDNWYENPDLSPDRSRNGASFAYSLILDYSKDVTIRRNVVLAPARPDGIGARVGFELGADNTQFYDNYVNGINHGVACNNTSKPGNKTYFGNNVFKDYIPHEGLSFGPSYGWYGGTNYTRAGVFLPGKVQGPNAPIDPVVLDRVAKGTKPGRNGRLSGGAKMQYDPGDFVYLSDLKHSASDNSWGPIELDQSNGRSGTNDGKIIALGNKTYDKGIGVAGDSTIVYDLGGRYARFFCDIGIDAIAGSNGSVTFEVWADGNKVYDSGLMVGGGAKKGISLKVDRVKELKLVTTNGGDGDRSDHANWAAARLLTPEMLQKYAGTQFAQKVKAKKVPAIKKLV